MGYRLMYPVTFYMVIFLQEVAESVKQDFGSIDILVHSLANGPEVKEILILNLV
jgi:enoyl-[acyl-carrier-protein] reductase (NADH)